MKHIILIFVLCLFGHCANGQSFEVLKVQQLAGSGVYALCNIKGVTGSDGTTGEAAVAVTDLNTVYRAYPVATFAELKELDIDADEFGKIYYCFEDDENEGFVYFGTSFSNIVQVDISKMQVAQVYNLSGVIPPGNMGGGCNGRPGDEIVALTGNGEFHTFSLPDFKRIDTFVTNKDVWNVAWVGDGWVIGMHDEVMHVAEDGTQTSVTGSFGQMFLVSSWANNTFLSAIAEEGVATIDLDNFQYVYYNDSLIGATELGCAQGSLVYIMVDDEWQVWDMDGVFFYGALSDVKIDADQHHSCSRVLETPNTAVLGYGGSQATIALAQVTF